MNKFIAVVGVLLLSTSCLKLEGNLQVSESLSAIEKYGFLNLKKRTIKISPANYSASVKIISAKNFTLQLKKDGNTIDIPVKAKNSLNIPIDGKFSIAAEQIGQPFNINGVINTDTESSSQTRELESCTKETKRVVCERNLVGEQRKDDHGKDDHGRDGHEHDGDNTPDCREITETYQGERRVVYHYETVDRDLQLEISKENSSAVSAVFSGKDSETSKVYDYTGNCF